jgi:ABC-type nitrate/sulfonate/bicarbonate transport system permease component
LRRVNRTFRVCWRSGRKPVGDDLTDGAGQSLNRATLGIAIGSCLAIIIAIELSGDYAASVGLGGVLYVATTINIIALVILAVSRLLQAVSRL